MKKIFLFLSPLIAISSTFYISCSEQHDPHEKPQIDDTNVQKQETCCCSNISCATATFNNFKFENIEQASDIQVYDSFNFSDSVSMDKECVISRFNTDLKSFNVAVRFTNVVSEDYDNITATGGFVFVINGETIKTQENYSITLENPKIIDPQESDYFASFSNSTCFISIPNFHFNSINDFDKLEIELICDQKIDYLYKIVNINNEQKTFDILLKLSIEKQYQRLPIKLSFIYRDFFVRKSKQFYITTNKNYINENAPTQHLLAPLKWSYDNHTSNSQTNVILHQFQLKDSFVDLNNIEVRYEQIGEQQILKFEPTIQNIDFGKKTFDINMKITTDYVDASQSTDGHLVFSYEGRDIYTTQKKYQFYATKFVPPSNINYSDDRKTVYGLKDGTTLASYEKQLHLEETITTIDKNAFANVLTGDNPICYLNLADESSASHNLTIGEQAFMNCTNLVGNLIFPNSTTEILSKAFSGCSNFDGTMKFNAKLSSIADDAFEGLSKISAIDLSCYDDIPLWATKHGSNIFKTFNPDGGIVYVKQELLSSWQTYLDEQHANLPRFWNLVAY